MAGIIKERVLALLYSTQSMPRLGVSHCSRCIKFEYKIVCLKWFWDDGVWNNCIL